MVVKRDNPLWVVHIKKNSLDNNQIDVSTVSVTH